MHVFFKAKSKGNHSGNAYQESKQKLGIQRIPGNLVNNGGNSLLGASICNFIVTIMYLGCKLSVRANCAVHLQMGII